MTRDELERCAKFLEQGLSLEVAMQKRLVLHALGNHARTHRDGCGWWRGGSCDCDDGEALDMRVKEALAR